MTKLFNGENVMVEVMDKICSALDCKMDDIIEIIPDEDGFANNTEKGE